jgi:hypothetical protein
LTTSARPLIPNNGEVFRDAARYVAAPVRMQMPMPSNTTPSAALDAPQTPMFRTRAAPAARAIRDAAPDFSTGFVRGFSCSRRA